MREFEVLPTEREFNQLAMEYNKLKLRQSILSADGALTAAIAAKGPKYEATAPIPDDIKEKALLIITHIRRLYSISPYNLRPNIRNILSLKLTNKDLFGEMPRKPSELTEGATFCTMLNAILGMQNTLIESIATMDSSLPRALNVELVAMHSLTLLKCYCI